MAKYKAYPEYKDSGVEWLGDIPEHWMAVRYKFCTKRVVVGIAEAATHAYADYGVPILRSTNVRENKLDTRGVLYIQDFFAKQNTSKFLFKNDIITVRTGFPGVSAVIPQCFDKSQCFTNLISTPRENYSPEFLSYCLNSSQGKSYFELSGWGSAQKNISVPILQDFPLALPLRNEQLKIVNFITHETVKIDNLIKKQKQLIELLKEKCQAVIIHSVTKGLNPDVTMKDSGVEWLGEVPEHWELVPLKYLCNFSGGGTPTKDNLSYWQGGTVPWVSPKDMKSFWISETQDYVTPKAVSESSTSYVEEGSLLMVVRSGILQRNIPVAINIVKVTMNQDMKALRFNERMKAHYAAHFINGNVNSLLLEWTKEGATVESIEHEYLANGLIPVPPIDEQHSIIKSISDQMIRFELLEEKALTGIRLLQERRTALISAAVTGKIDVRDWVAPDAQDIEASQEVTA